MKKGHENKIEGEEHAHQPDGKTYFLAKQWLMKTYLRSRQTLRLEKKKK